MLAGKMKLTTFLTVIAVATVCGTAGFAFATLTMAPEAPAVIVVPEPVPTEAAPTIALDTTPVERPADADASVPAAHVNARDIDVVVFSYVGKDLGTDKLKDVSRNKRFKVNVYQDAGEPTANRAKVDLDRDDKWDEKFTFADGTITRQVAPNDDEVYTERTRWDGKDWIEGG